MRLLFEFQTLSLYELALLSLDCKRPEAAFSTWLHTAPSVRCRSFLMGLEGGAEKKGHLASEEAWVSLPHRGRTQY